MSSSSAPTSSRTDQPRTSTYYRVSGGNSLLGAVPVEVAPHEAERAVADLPAYLPPSSIEAEAKDGPIGATSWRVSDDEFIVKIDASPLHMSAARRIFDRQRKDPAAVEERPADAVFADGGGGGDDAAEMERQHEGEWRQFWNKMMKVYMLQKN